MKKKLLPITLGLALMALAGTAYAQSATTTTDAATQQKQVFKGGDKAKSGGVDRQELLSLLNMDEATLRSELKAGKSLAAIGATKGVSKQQIIDLLVKQDTARLAQALADGKLTQAQVDLRKVTHLRAITQKVDQIEESGSKGYGPGKHGGPGGLGGPGGMEAASYVLGMTSQEIGEQLRLGKSLSEIAQEKGISRQQLIDALVKDETERISLKVDAKN